MQVHERTLQGDFLMALLKDLVVTRRAAGRPLKVRLCRRPPETSTRNQHPQQDCMHSSPLSVQPSQEVQALW